MLVRSALFCLKFDSFLEVVELSSSRIDLTEEQHTAVTNRGGGLLVSAAAGSGKTRVLVERLLRRVEEEGLDINRFLIITYTKAAAAELRGRIAEELAIRLSQQPADRHLRRQATLVYQTQISTIHAFCAQLLREYGHLLDLEADFRLCDESEAGVFMLQAMDQVLESRYDKVEAESDFAKLLDTMAAGRDDSRLVQIVLDIHGRVQSHPDPSAWLEQQEQAFALEGVTDVGETSWGAALLGGIHKQVEYWRGRMAHALDLCAGDDALSRSYAPSLSATLESLSLLMEAAEKGWDAAAARSEIVFPRLGAVRNCGDPEAQVQIKVLREKCKKRMVKVGELLSDPSEHLLEDMRAVYPAVRGLFALVHDFDQVYTALKRQRGCLDFSDLVHMAVKLLRDNTGEPSELSEVVSSRFTEVMVDEYQDTNEVQNAIFQAVSQQGKKLFMVGDVKQSIYRFRLADPTIFLEKYRSFQPADQAADGEPRRVLLTQNFRSRPQVLEGTNFLFRSLMSREFGEMDYTLDEALHPGHPFPEGESYAVELDVLDLSEEGGEEAQEEKAPRDFLEARFTARRVRTLLDSGFQITDRDGGMRKAGPGDMVILLRSPNTVLHHYAKALGELDIPWEAEGSGDFLNTTEVSVALSYLQIIDNPRQDVPLISVLRSPLWGFSPDRLAQIRSGTPDTDFYSALLQDQGGDTVNFLAELERLRDQAVDMSCHQLLWRLYDQTHFLGIFGALGDGETRRGNLLSLAECARQFEAAGHKGLFGFLSYLDRVRASGGRLLTGRPGGEGGGVRIMSIHKSKGLEFPVVFLCGLARRLNREDMQRPILFHSRLGVGPKGLDTERMVEFPTLARRAVAGELEREMMAEELRLLYVAMTRAKEKLVMVCALSQGARELQRLAGDAGCPVEPQALLATQSVAQWILLAVLVRPDAGALRRAMDTYVEITTEDCGPDWEIHWVPGGDLRQVPTRTCPGTRGVEEETVPEADPELVVRLSWRYQHQEDVEIPSKLTATQLKGRTLDQEAAEAAPAPARPLRFQRPRFAAEALGLTPAQRGTALHLVMQFLDFHRAETREGAAAEIARLVERALITPQQGEAADPERVAAFFASDMGQELLRSNSVQREFKFSILVPARDYYPEAGKGEEVLLQGVVDCWFETLEGITVLDFKTDRVTNRTLLERAEEYRPQLTAYSRALEEITGKKVCRRVLWFFALDCPVEI